MSDSKTTSVSGDNLCKGAGELKEDATIHSVHMDKNGCEIITEHPIFAKMAYELGKVLTHYSAPNFITLDMRSEGETFEVTVRRGYGKTPAQRIAELEQELATRAPQQAAGEWISVEDGLPEDANLKVVKYYSEKWGRGGINVSRYSIPSNMTTQMWALEFGSTQRSKVTHWMPLPTATAGEGRV